MWEIKPSILNVREIDRCAYGRREKRPTKIRTNRPEGEDWQRQVQGGEVHWSANAERAGRAPESDVPEQEGEIARHRGQKRRTQREGSAVIIRSGERLL